MRPQASAAGLPNGCMWAIGGVVALALLSSLGKCSSNTNGNSVVPAGYNQATDDLGNAVSAQTPPPVQPLSAASVKRGVGHFRLAFSSEGLSGAMIYSQNCYDALAREFSWAKLDACGAADMMALQSLVDDDGTGLEKEASYFEAEAAAGRYISAATSAGEAADDADTRLSALQDRVRKALRAMPSLPPPILTDDNLDVTENLAVLEDVK